MRHEAFPADKREKTASERREEELVSRVADEAAKLLAAKTYSPPHHIWQAMSQVGIRKEAERSKYFGKVREELGRREAQVKHEAARREEQVLRDARRSPAARYEAEERARENDEE